MQFCFESCQQWLAFRLCSPNFYTNSVSCTNLARFISILYARTCIHIYVYLLKRYMNNDLIYSCCSTKLSVCHKYPMEILSIQVESSVILIREYSYPRVWALFHAFVAVRQLNSDPQQTAQQKRAATQRRPSLHSWQQRWQPVASLWSDCCVSVRVRRRGIGHSALLSAWYSADSILLGDTKGRN